ncbi:unnamed protein product, partial [Pylaiella littoralis]
EEHRIFLEGLERYGSDWNAISNLVKTRTPVQTRTHHQKFDQQKRKGRQFPEEPYETEHDGDGATDITRLTIAIPSSSPLPPSSSATATAATTTIASPSTGVTSVPRLAAAVVRGKRLTPPLHGRRGSGSGGTPRSTRASSARATEAAKKASATEAAAAGGGDGTTGEILSGRAGVGAHLGWEGGFAEGGTAKRLKIDHPAPAAAAASAYGGYDRRHSSPSSFSACSSNFSGVPTNLAYSNGVSLMKAAMRGVGDASGVDGGANIDVGVRGGGGGGGGIASVSAAAASSSASGSRQLPPSLSENFLAGLLVESAAVQAPAGSVFCYQHPRQQHQPLFPSP